MNIIKYLLLVIIIANFSSCNEKENYATDNLTIVPENFSDFEIYDQSTMDVYRDADRRRAFLEMTGVNKFWMQKDKYDWKDVHNFYLNAIQEYKDEPLLDLLQNKTITILIRDFGLINKDEIPDEIITFYARHLAGLRSVNFENSYKLLKAAKPNIESDEFSKRVEFEIYKLDYSTENSEEIIKNSTNARVKETEVQFLRQSNKEREELKSLL